MNAVTTVWGLRPSTSPKGPIIGMVAAAWPEPEMMKQFMMTWNMYMNRAPITFGMPLSRLEKPYTMVSVIKAWSMTRLMAFANPTTRAPTSTLLAPATNSSHIRLPLKPPVSPHTIAMIRNTAAIWVPKSHPFRAP